MLLRSIGAALCACSLLYLAGCTTAQIAKKVDLLSFSTDLKPGKSIGRIKSEVCTVQVLSIGPRPDLQDAINRTRARYVKNLEIDRVFEDYFVWSRDCWFLAGEGFY